MTPTLPACFLMTAAHISTGHVTRETMDALSAEHGFGAVCVLMTSDYGVLLYHDGDEPYARDEVPGDLHELILWLRKHQLEYCRLDSGAMEVDDLPTYDW